MPDQETPAPVKQEVSNPPLDYQIEAQQRGEQVPLYEKAISDNVHLTDTVDYGRLKDTELTRDHANAANAQHGLLHRPELADLSVDVNQELGSLADKDLKRRLGEQAVSGGELAEAHYDSIKKTAAYRKARLEETSEADPATDVSISGNVTSLPKERPAQPPLTEQDIAKLEVHRGEPISQRDIDGMNAIRAVGKHHSIV